MRTYFLFHLFHTCAVLYSTTESHGNSVNDVLGNTINTVTNPLTKICKTAKGSTEEKNIHFYLYSRNHYGHELELNDKATIEEVNFSDKKQIKVLIHGHAGNEDTTPNHELRPVYLERTDFYVISVDYGFYDCYLQALNSAKAIAQYCNTLIDAIIESNSEIRLNEIHLIGFSLGAHVAGLMGHLRPSDTPQYGRITGLDPALPLHNFDLFFRALEKSDAKFVDVIHTNMGVLGRVKASGHVDFYANNGVLQPGCGIDINCSHFRSADYYAESITNGQFPAAEIGIWAAKCTTFLKCFCRRSRKSELILFGEYVERSLTGIYYFITNKQTPFGRGRIDYTEKREGISKEKLNE